MLETEVLKHMKIPVGTNRKVVLVSVGCNKTTVVSTQVHAQLLDN